jgi:sialate O-acetylesterase
MKNRFLAGLWLLALLAAAASADVRLPDVINSNMVLQQASPVPIWGFAEPNEEVAVRFSGQTKTVKADGAGKWLVRLDPLKVSRDPHVMTVSGKNTIRLENILVGEVWLCAGQSNMEFALSATTGGAKEVAAADWPEIRLLHVPRTACLEPASDAHARWEVCDPRTAGGFSAVGYFFGRKLHGELGVPIGLIQSAWGGSRIEPWTWPAELEAWPWGKAATKKRSKDAKTPGPTTRQAGKQDPGALYNGMIAPVSPFAIRGATWYQGEDNVDDGLLYRQKLHALIGGWRKAWNQGDFPFFYVQLAPFRYVYHKPDSLPQIWEAQLSCLSIPRTGMAVTTDLVQDITNIHPPDKADVGLRLALWALAKTYARTDLVYSGPLYKSMSVDGSSIRVQFHCVGGGLASRDGKALSCFEIAGANKEFLAAQARIEGETVVVWCPELTAPVAVRMGGTDTDRPNLANREGLPAAPFRTDELAAAGGDLIVLRGPAGMERP